MTEPSYELIDTRTPKEGRDKNGAFFYVARIWKTPTGFFVKTHTREVAGFGKLSWIITGSLCDAAGVAIRDEAGPMVHDRAHVFVPGSEGEGSIDDAAAGIKADFITQHKFVVATIEKIARDLAVARAAIL